jgi:hypothetical protein
VVVVRWPLSAVSLYMLIVLAPSRVQKKAGARLKLLLGSAGCR